MSRRVKHGHCHGGVPSPTYSTWTTMKARCTNPNNMNYQYYGARGITVCERWLHSFENFLADMGEKPAGLTLERKDNNKSYSPENCKWAGLLEQARNSRNCHYVTFQGRSQTITEWGRELGIHRASVLLRLKRWPIEEALTRRRQQ